MTACVDLAGMDREPPRNPPADRLETLKRRLDELARQLGTPTPGRRAAIPVPIDPRRR